MQNDAFEGAKYLKNTIEHLERKENSSTQMIDSLKKELDFMRKNDTDTLEQISNDIRAMSKLQEFHLRRVDQESELIEWVNSQYAANKGKNTLAEVIKSFDYDFRKTVNTQSKEIYSCLKSISEHLDGVVYIDKEIRAVTKHEREIVKEELQSSV